MDYNLKEVGARLRGLREDLEFTVAQAAVKTDVPVEEYQAYESGDRDFSLSFLYKCAEVFGVELIELLTGDSPRLNTYTVVRNGEGLPIERRERFAYKHLAYLFKNKQIEPLLVTAPFEPAAQDMPIKLSSHSGQEFDYVIKGSLKIVIGGHTEILNAGDSVYYDSLNEHGMIAVGGEDCEFLAILIKK